MVVGVCGRYVQASSPTMLGEQFGVEEIAVPPEREADYNVAPRKEVLMVVERPGAPRTLEQVRWGLVPWWAKDPSVGDRLINARAETIATKPAYQESFRRRRCIVPADGFYEWQAAPGRKQPMFVHARDGEPLAFAGLWDSWRDPAAPDGERMVTNVVVTTEANHTMRAVHDRMPVILPASLWDAWLAPEEADPAELEAFLVPAPDDLLELRPVGPKVGDVRNNGPELVERDEPLTLFS
jgi:putative SOS response-associated peptidase YedK